MMELFGALVMIMKCDVIFNECNAPELHRARDVLRRVYRAARGGALHQQPVIPHQGQGGQFCRSPHGQY